MASPQASDHLATRYSFQMWDHDPDSASAKIVTPDASTTVRVVDMSNFGRFAVGAMTTVIAGAAITKVEIIASDSSDGTGNVIVIKDSGTVAADAQGDWVWLECTAEEIRQEAADDGTSTARYVAARITLANSGDEAAVVYIREGRHQYDALTAATTIA